MNALKQYIDLYDANREVFDLQSPALLNNLRRVAREHLEGARLPRKGSEDYEATDLEAVFGHDYGVNVNRLPFEADPSETFHCDVPNMSTCLYYSSNDAFHSSATAERNIGKVVVEPFSMAAVDYPELMTAYYGRQAQMSDPVVALNSLLVQDGLFIYVPDGVVAERPIQLVNIFNAALDMMVQRRLLIVVGKNAAIKLLACDHTQSSDYRYLNNQVVEIVAMQGAMIDYYDMEESTPLTSRVSSIYVDQHEGSNVLYGKSLARLFGACDDLAYPHGVHRRRVGGGEGVCDESVVDEVLSARKVLVYLRLYDKMLAIVAFVLEFPDSAEICHLGAFFLERV